MSSQRAHLPGGDLAPWQAPMVNVWLTGLPVQPTRCQRYVSYRAQQM